MSGLIVMTLRGTTYPNGDEVCVSKKLRVRGYGLNEADHAKLAAEIHAELGRVTLGEVQALVNRMLVNAVAQPIASE